MVESQKLHKHTRKLLCAHACEKKNENKTEDRRCVSSLEYFQDRYLGQKKINCSKIFLSTQKPATQFFFGLYTFGFVLFKKIPIYNNNNNENNKNALLVLTMTMTTTKKILIITLCMVYSRSSGGSCVGCRSQNVRNASDTCSTGRVSRRCANVCVRLGGVCAWTLLGIRCTCVDADL